LVATKISELGENIIIRRFTRYAVGEPIGNEVTTSAPAEVEAETPTAVGA
jgi:hypothetical protein